MTVLVAGVPNSLKTPGNYAQVVLGGPGTSAGASPIRAIIFANMIATPLTGSAPSFTTNAGTYLAAGGGANESPVQTGDPDDAKAKFGQGSEAHLGAKAYFAQDPSGTLFVCPVAESAGSAATATLTFVGSATANGTIRVYVKGVAIDVPITSGDAIAVMSQNVAKAIAISNPDLPVTAQFALGVVTVTAKHKGTRGNNITFRSSFINGSNEIVIGTSTSQFGTAVTISGAKLTGGTTADSATNAIASIAATPFDRMALAFDDTTNINLFRDDLGTKAGPLVMYWGQAIAATVASPNTATTQAPLINDPRVQLVCLKNADALTVEIAAQVMAARINGDSSVTSTNPVLGENVDPAANLNGVLLKTIQVQPLSSDRPTRGDIETMLNNGVTPLEPSPEHPGYVKVTASITTKHKDGAGAYTYAVYKTKVVTVSDYVARGITTDYRTRYKGKKLTADPADGSSVNIPNVVTPRMVRDNTIGLLRVYEKAGIITQVDAFLPQLSFNINALNNQRLDGDVPEFPTPDLDIAAVNIRQVQLAA